MIFSFSLLVIHYLINFQHIKGVFVSPENTFRKLFYALVCVWQLWKIRSMENYLRFDRKISHFECKIIYALILPSNNFQKSHLKRESSRSLLTRSKTHIQAHLSQALASPDRAAPQSQTHLQAYLQTISREKKKKEQEERVEPARSRTPQLQIAPLHPTLVRTTTPYCTTAPNPRSHRSRRTLAPARLHP